MKKIIGFLSVALVLITMACTNEPAEVKKEVIVVPSAPVIIVKDPPEKSTKVTLDKNGVKVETKKVDVTVKNK
jgi:copper chaperone CopZ